MSLINPEREAKRLAEAQRVAEETAAKGMAHPGANMVAVFSVAGFELADVFAEWARRHSTGDCEELGPPCLSTAPVDPKRPTGERRGETPEEFGERCARAVLKLIKEV